MRGYIVPHAANVSLNCPGDKIARPPDGSTPAIGTGYVDVDYLASRGIAFANASGRNAIAVKECVVA